MTVRKLRLFPCVLFVLVLVGCFSTSHVMAQSASGLPVCDPDNGGLILPEGFCGVLSS